MDIERKIEEVEEKVNEHSLAYEIMMELKRTIRRQWIALIVVIGLWAGTIAGFLIYLNQYDYIGYNQDGNGFNNVNVQNGGDIFNNNGTESKNTDAQKR